MKNRIALLSVFDKTGLLDFALALIDRCFTLLASSGTATFLKGSGLEVTEISDYTGSEEILDGRLKTLHPKIYAGLLAQRDDSNHLLELKKRGFDCIDLIAVNFYDFSEEIGKYKCTLNQAIRKIDIGGPSIVRAAAKNCGSKIDGVTVIVDPVDYPFVLDHMNKDGQVAHSVRLKLSEKAYLQTSNYDRAISSYLNSINESSKKVENPKDFPLPNEIHIQLEKKNILRYGENPHQRAAVYLDKQDQSGWLENYYQIQGKELSLNNVVDADAAWECVRSFSEPSCVIVKHANPCGVATGNSLLNAYQKAFKADPISAFGGTIAFNFSADSGLINAILNNQFVETILAPGYEKGIIKVFEKKKNVRVLKIPIETRTNRFSMKEVGGGWLVQESDILSLPKNSMTVVTKRRPNSKELNDMLFAWNVVRHVKSNAVVFARNGMTLGIGTGQMSRIDSVRIASIKARNNQLLLKNSVMASDAFFPFGDALDLPISEGVNCVIHPGGGIREHEIISLADEKNISIIVTGVRCFKH